MLKILNKFNILQKNQQTQRGAVLMVMLVILIVGGSALLLNSLSNTSLRTERDKKTADALAQAKEALIGYAANNDPPGRLPCPENTVFIGTSTEGQQISNCGNGVSIGRLPWRTLGVGPIRDSSGEPLWYAISPGFRKPLITSPPINSDSLAQLTIDGVPNSAVAIIFSAGPPINGQIRPVPTALAALDPAQYLELSNNVANSTAFVSNGPSTTFNDRLLIVTHSDLFRVVEKRVAKEVVNSLNEYYCGAGNVNPAGGCLAVGGNRFYPRPADFTDANCLGNFSIASMPIATSCPSSALNKGRIPAHPATDWDITSLLYGSNSSLWFQKNGWREVVFYAVATTCADGTTNCGGGSGNLTLNDPPGSTLLNQKVVVIVTGSAIPTQLHTTGNKNTISNYLEDENLAPFDDTFTKKTASPFNDIAISIP